MSLRLVLWNYDSIYTRGSETTRMFKEVLVDVSECSRRDQKVMECERRKWNMAEELT